MSAPGLSKIQILVMTITAGICVANIYYNQPLLQSMAQSFGTNERSTGLIAVLTQAGYGLGLFFITPLGDKINRKKLILVLQLLLILALAGMAFSSNVFMAYTMSLCIGMMAVAAQVILPMAATLSPQNKGKIVGIIFTGILTGILAARVVSGYIAAWLSWRYVYGISAGLVLISCLITQLVLPGLKSEFKGNYLQLLQSTLVQMKRFALLRRTALLGALIFGAFCSFWTVLTFHLGGEPFHYRSDTIGLFGLLAIGGALIAPTFGKLADKGNPARSQVMAIALLIFSLFLIKFFPLNIPCFIVAVILLDIGVQATQVTNLATIYTLDETAHSRINTVYMTTYFIGGALGTYVGVQCWQLGGWPLVTLQLLIWSGIAFAIALNAYSRTKFIKQKSSL